ncbi:MAG: hypothetical protein ACWGN2_05500 [Anaerolineales bacterium]
MSPLTQTSINLRVVISRQVIDRLFYPANLAGEDPSPLDKSQDEDKVNKRVPV